LGEDKRQIDALVSLAIALMVVAVNWATDIITGMMPFLAIALVSILVFLLLYGFVASDKDGKGIEVPKWAKIVMAVIATAVVIIALIVASDQWDTVYNFLFKEGNDGFWTNFFIIVVVVVAVVAVLLGGRKGKVSSES